VIISRKRKVVENIDFGNFSQRGERIFHFQNGNSRWPCSSLVHLTPEVSVKTVLIQFYVDICVLDFGFGYLVGRAPNWGIAPTGCGVWTTCPRLLLMVRDRTHDLAVIGSDTLTTRLPSHLSTIYQLPTPDGNRDLRPASSYSLMMMMVRWKAATT